MQNNKNTYKLTTDIIPIAQSFVGEKKTLDKEAICFFAATGFFLDQDSYYTEQKALKPACNYLIDKDSQTVLSETPYFNWHYKPLERSFEKIVDEFAVLFERIVKEQSDNKQVILPLSGGLDSRTQAIALKHLGIKPHVYSYAFKGGHDETKYSKQIASLCHFPFEALEIPNGYLWNSIDALANMTQCYSEFTHSRQMACVDRYSKMGDVFSLGHWGDVLFDDMGVDDDLSIEGQVDVILKKIIKKGGLELALSLWDSWGLKGDFKIYLKTRILTLLQSINIKDNANAQIRAFKSLYWAPRWTSINLRIFDSVHPISLPYYDNRMCEFICAVPERYLAGRQIQIAYIKKRMPELAKLTWEAHRPFNLYNYSYNKIPWNLPYRVLNKMKRLVNRDPFIQRNWELQFLGQSNDQALRNWLFDNTSFDVLVSRDIREQYYKLFKEEDAVYYSHAVSMLLTLSVFSTKQLKN
ncbi:asparagine synthetase B family protein [Xanthomarina sp. GH4-25]|uniref:asparagine synthetase B family protein n=1 Tax=Xanthomarina sp. GH4-25 TaxID=3349335 RepID=UPI0038782B23